MIEHMFPMAVPSDDSCAELLAGLNEEQRAAVTHEGNPLLVLGARSGKTTTLCSRLPWLVLAQGFRRSGFCC